MTDNPLGLAGGGCAWSSQLSPIAAAAAGTAAAAAATAGYGRLQLLPLEEGGDRGATTGLMSSGTDDAWCRRGGCGGRGEWRRCLLMTHTTGSPHLVTSSKLAWVVTVMLRLLAALSGKSCRRHALFCALKPTSQFNRSTKDQLGALQCVLRSPRSWKRTTVLQKAILNELRQQTSQVGMKIAGTARWWQEE